MMRNGNGACAADDLWTPDDIELLIVAMVRLWQRSPGSGTSPWATDFPAYMMTRDVRAGDYDARGTDGQAPPPRRLPLSRELVTLRDRLSDWFLIVPAQDRRLIWAAAQQLARGAARISWLALRDELGLPIGAGGYARRYERGCARMAQRLNALCVARMPLLARLDEV